ncbi:MAG: AtpZ/AtpI family protein [Lachnospiraceae bacterium]|nr:AtpZ/AtpI family protein [Lachnospiraceae bacterium]
MKYDKSVYRSLALITQFGINMLVPIFLCTIVGVYLGRKFSIDWMVIPLFIVGALAGFRNIFIMAKRIYATESSAVRSARQRRKGEDTSMNASIERGEDCVKKN